MMGKNSKLIKEVESFYAEAIMGYKLMEQRAAKNSKIFKIKKVDYDQMIQGFQTLIRRAGQIDFDNITLEDDDSKGYQLKGKLREYTKYFISACENYAKMQEAQKNKSLKQIIGLEEYKQIMQRIRENNKSMLYVLHDIDTLYGEYSENIE